jgi:hypothetical protein
LGPSEDAARELADTAEGTFAARRKAGIGRETVMAKKKSTDMEAVRQRRYPDEILGMSNSIPRDTEFDLTMSPSRTRIGFDECSFESPKPGNAMWTEKDRP